MQFQRFVHHRSKPDHMKHKIPLLAAAFLLATCMADAQNLGEIRGRILDPAGEPVPMATIITEVSGQVHGTTSEMDGRFVLKPLSPGMYSVRISFVGFKTIDVPGVEVTSDRATYIADTRMKFHAALDTFEIVTYRRPQIIIDDPSRMSLLAEDFVKDPNKRNPIAFIGNNFAGVTQSIDGDGLHFRGSRTENMVSFIDGVKVSGAMPRIPPSAISSVSVYTGGIPAKYGDVTGGVVVIETKTYNEVFQAERARQARQAEQEMMDIE